MLPTQSSSSSMPSESSSSPIPSDRSMEYEALCQVHFKQKAKEVAISQPVPLTLQKIFAIARLYFQFPGDPPPSLPPQFHSFFLNRFCRALGNYLHPCEKVNIPRLIESQILFRKMAVLRALYLYYSPDKTGKGFADYLEKIGMLASTRLAQKDKENFYSLVEKSFSYESAFKNEDATSMFMKLCANYGIYDLQTGMAGPEYICDDSTLSTFDKNLRQSTKKQAYDLCGTFIVESLKTPIEEVECLDEQRSEEYEKRLLRMTCRQLRKFVEYALVTLHVKRNDFHLFAPQEFLCSPFLNQERHQTSHVACTLLQPLLSYLGYQVDILMRLDIPPKCNSSFAHTVLSVTSPGNKQKFLVDPTFKQFLKDPSSIEEDIFVCPFEELEEVILSCSSQDPHEILKTVWDPSGYSLVTQNYIAEELFHSDSKSPLSNLLKPLIQKMGLEKIYSLASPQMKMQRLRAATKIGKLSILEVLRSLHEECQQPFADPFGLDTRPIHYGLLKFRTVGYAMAIRESINPDLRSEKTTLYGCAGSDLSMALLATNATQLYMVDQTSVDITKLKKALEAIPSKVKETYLYERYNVGGGRSQAKNQVDYMDDIENRIIIELQALGVDLKKVIIQPAESFRGVSLSFPWAYQNGPLRTYMVTWIGASIIEPENYPPGLKTLLANQSFDFYYQKAATRVPQQYEKFIAAIGNGLKEGGFMLTSDVDNHSVKHDPVAHLQKGDADFPLAKENLHPEIKAFENLFSGELHLGYKWDKHGDFSIPLQASYWVFTTIRKKTKKSFQESKNQLEGNKG